MAKVRIYNFDPKTDGWKTFPDAPVKPIKIDQKQRGIREFDIPLTHYVKNGKTLCGQTEPEGTIFYNDVRNQCDKCRQGVREQTILARKALESNDESINVIDYKAAETDDHPETATVSH